MSMSLAPFSAIESRIAASTLTMLANVVVTPAGGEPFGAEFDLADIDPIAPPASSATRRSPTSPPLACCSPVTPS